MNQTAYLSNRGEYTTFSVGDRTITFLTSKNLEKYIEVVEWDQGYLVVISKNKGKEQEGGKAIGWSSRKSRVHSESCPEKAF